MTNSTTLAAGLLAAALLATAAHADDVLTPEVRAKATGQLVWHDGSGGATTRARDATLNKDFVAETGVDLRGDFNADMTKFFAAMDAGAEIPWSMVEFPTYGDFLRARDAGYLQKLDTTIVDKSQVEPETWDDYGIEATRYGIVLTYNTETFPGDAAPKTVADLYDTAKFPGKRCLFKYPQFGGVLESALVADGATRDDLYPLDLDRAFAKLDTIKGDIIWWNNGDEAIRLISSGECALGIAWSGRVYGAVKNDGAPLALAWQDSFYSQGAYGVPVGAPNADAGQAMVAHYIADKAGQIAFVKEITYTSPIAGIPLADYGADLAPWIVAGENAEKAIPENAEFYSKNLPDILDRFNRWIVLD